MSEENKDIEVNDLRRSGFFMVDNHVLDLYGKHVGVTAWAVYTTFIRCTKGRSKTTFISVGQIAKVWGISAPTVKRATRKLRKFSLIRVTKTQGISRVDLLDVEQLNFDEKLLSGGITIDPTERVPEGSPVIPRKDHQRPLGGITTDPLLNTKKTYKTLRSSTGTDQRPGSPKVAQLEKQMQEIRERGMQLLKGSPGKVPKEVRELQNQLDRLARQLVTARGSARAQ